jgi:hypothetical protein
VFRLTELGIGFESISHVRVERKYTLFIPVIDTAKGK